MTIAPNVQWNLSGSGDEIDDDPAVRNAASLAPVLARDDNVEVDGTAVVTLTGRISVPAVRAVGGPRQVAAA